MEENISKQQNGIDESTSDQALSDTSSESNPKPRKLKRDNWQTVGLDKKPWREEVRMGTGSESLLQKSREIFQQRIDNHEIDRLINPFSEFWGQNKDDYLDKLENAKAVWKGADKRTKLTKVDDKYGRPVEGTLTEYRGNKAKNFIAKNIIECCETIKNTGKQAADGTYEIPFGVLFKAYERINDKLVGLLVRARRHGLLDFPGEMLYQRQDDHVIVKLFKVPELHELELKYINFKAEKPTEDSPTVQ